MNRILNKLTFARRLGGKYSTGLLALLGVSFLATSVQAQEDFRLRYFRPAPLRQTVSVNTTNTGTFTNLVSLSTNISSVTLSVSNLPAGCGYDLVTTNGSAGLSVTFTNDQALSIVVNSTNLAQGEYTFWLMGAGPEATNRFPFVIQSAYVWQGTNDAAAQFNATYNWTNSPSWVGGNNPGLSSGNDVVFGDLGGQTNRMANGITFTNIQIDQDVTVGSMRFGAGTYTNLVVDATNALYHHVRLNGANRTLTVNGTRGFSLLRDYIAEYGNNAGSKPDRKTGLIFSGGNGSKLLVTNFNADFAILLDGGNASGESFLAMTNIGTFAAAVNRFGAGDFQLYPNYREMNRDTNGLGAVPRQFINSIFFARTNHIIANYRDPDNYTNANTRSHAITWLNGETSGNGSGTANQLHFGLTNRFLADSVCFVGANHASGNAGFVRYNTSFDANAFALFRATNGTGRMSVFTVSDGGGTNAAGSNMKANLDFSTLVVNGAIRTATTEILADRFYIARDRSIIAESNTVNYQGTVMFGRGTVDVNTAILGYQEHQVRRNNAQPQLGYCQGILTVTNQGTFKVNGQLTLGYTADTNSVADAEHYNTYGRLTVNGATVIASNIMVDGGPRNYSHTEGTARQDFINLVGANLIVSNTIGNLPGQPLNSFSTERSTNVWFVAVDRTNLFCRTLSTPGTEASVIKVAGIAGVTSLPATLPVISYETASSPYLKADTTGNGLTNGYLLNDTVNKTINLFLTTNAPRTLLWTGSANSDWDTNSLNWVLIGTATPAKFAIGDIAVFDDTSTATNVNVVGEVVPGQTGAGVTVSNSVRQYTFSGSGVIAGTSALLKVGAEKVTFTTTKQGPVTVLAGPIEVGSGGTIGLTTLASNVTLSVLSGGTVNGGLTSTGTVTVASGGLIAGPTRIVAGSLDNSGTVSTAPGNFTLDTENALTLINQATGIINAGGASGTQCSLNSNSVFGNLGVLNNLVSRLNVYGSMYGNGTVSDPDSTGGGGGLFPAGIDGRLELRNPTGVISPGATLTNSIGTLNVFTRFDIDGVNGQGRGALLIEVDKSNAQTNDAIAADYWSNIQGKIAMRNINPGMPFAAGDFFRVLINNNSPGDPYGFFNQPDNTIGDHPFIDPVVPGPGLQWDLTDFRNYGVIKVKANTMIWNGNLGSTWDTNGANLNWQGGIAYTNVVGAVFDESSALKTVVVSSIVSPGGYMLTTNIPSPGTTNVFTNSVGISPGIIVSNSGTYLFSAVSSNTIEGYTGLYKTGSGTLDLGNMSNRFTGPVIIDQGVVVVSVYTNNSTPSPLGAPGLNARAPATSERLMIGGGSTLRFSGLSTNTADRGMTILAGGATLEISNSAAHLLLGGQFRGDGGALTKTGPGTVTLGNSGNSMTNLTVTDGLVRFSAAAAGAGHLIVTGGSLGFTNNVSMTNLINLAVNTTIHNTNNTVLGGSWTGTGNVTITNFTSLAWTRDMTNYTGDITFVGGGTNRFNNATNSNNARGSAGAVFDLGASGRLDNFNGGDTNGPVTYHLGGLAGGASAVLAGRFSNTVVVTSGSIYSIGAKGTSTTFSGTIIDGPGSGTVALLKVGSGTLALDGVNTYTGSTTVSNGTLGGSGSIVSALTVQPSGTIAPGNSVGTFTVSNNVTLGGATLMELNPAGSDLLRVTGTLTGGGTLTVTNIGSTLTNGTVFTLFSQPVSGFTLTNLPAGYVWTDNLAVNGSITVVTNGIVPVSVNTTPTNITSSVSGNTLTLSWPSDHIGWRLTTQTNALSIGLTTPTNTWFDVSGSSTTNSVDITIDPTQPTVFFRLVYP